ncbi:MCP four helix bundle domain-containing protein, partial [Microvirga soli]|uniref:MCP four helix bundle domain-containing protein n=1 Tax=Microvirga soli TaxID=1854496 RepID=UPI00191D0250
MRALNNLKIITKLAIPVIVMMAVTIGLIIFAKAGLDTLAEETQQIVDVHAARRSMALNIKASVSEAAVQEKNLIIETRFQEMAVFEQAFRQAKEEALKGLDALIALSELPERRASNEQLKKIVEDYFAIMGRTIAHAQLNEADEAFKLSNGEGRDMRQKASQALNELAAANAATLEQEKRDAAELASFTSAELIIASVVGLTLAIAILGAITVYGITRPLNGMTSAMGRLAAGDLDVSVTGTERRDEVGLL